MNEEYHLAQEIPGQARDDECLGFAHISTTLNVTIYADAHCSSALRNIISRRKKPGSTVVMKLNSKTVAIWPSFDGNGVFASFFAGKKMRNCTHNICHSRRGPKGDEGNEDTR